MLLEAPAPKKYNGPNSKEIYDIMKNHIPKDLQNKVFDAIRDGTNFSDSSTLDALDEVWAELDRTVKKFALAKIFMLANPEYNSLKQLSGTIEYLIANLGFNLYDNPFMSFLNNYFSANSYDSLTDKGLEALAKLYIQGEISPEDLETSGETILHNENLYYMPQNIEFYVKLFKWLQDKGNMNAIREKVNEEYRDLDDYTLQKLILFKKPDADVEKDALTSVNDLKKILSGVAI